jgi:hypothetical protein
MRPSGYAIAQRLRVVSNVFHVGESSTVLLLLKGWVKPAGARPKTTAAPATTITAAGRRHLAVEGAG